MSNHQGIDGVDGLSFVTGAIWHRPREVTVKMRAWMQMNAMNVSLMNEISAETDRALAAADAKADAIQNGTFKGGKTGPEAEDREPWILQEDPLLLGRLEKRVERAALDLGLYYKDASWTLWVTK